MPDGVDLLAFYVNHTRVLEHLRPAAERRVQAAVVFDGGFAEAGEEGRRRQEELVAICRSAGIALCGPNCMGVVNPHARSMAYFQALRDPVPLAGNVGLISQSGSICIGMLADCRRFGYSHVISSGNEAVLTAADFLEYLVDDPATRVIAIFIETVREPERFVAALDRAADRGKPVVVLKVGKNERSRRAITSHTGGLAGEARVFSAVLRAHRAIEVADLDELSEVLACCQAERWPKGRRLAVMTSSGGQAELILDLAAPAGLDLPPLSPAARAEAERVIGPLTGDGNPLDAWGNGDFRTNAPHGLGVLGADPDTDCVAWCTDSADDQPLGNPEQLMEYARMVASAAKASTKPFYLMTTRSGIFRRDQLEYLRGHGITVIGGTRQGLGAIDRLARHAAPLPAPRPVLPPSRRGLSALLAGRSRRTIHEHESKSLLREAGLPVLREKLVTTLEEAVAAAAGLGYPVVLKLVSDDVPHRSDLGLIEVGLRDGRELAMAWERLSGRRSELPRAAAVDGFVVQEMVAGGVEVFAGVSRDPDFGLVLAFGLGGIAVELIGDVTLRPLPLRMGDAEAMVAAARASKLLAGVRGHPPADLAALHQCLYALADYACADSDAIGEIDLNPTVVLPAGKGCVVVDALIVPRRHP